MIYAGSKFAQCFSDFFVINDIDFAAYLIITPFTTRFCVVDPDAILCRGSYS